jgi:hypothetical protein
VGWKQTLGWDMADRSTRLYHRGTVIGFVGSTGSAEDMAEIVGTRHGPDSDMLLSSCRLLRDPWSCQSCNQMLALVSLSGK